MARNINTHNINLKNAKNTKNIDNNYFNKCDHKKKMEEAAACAALVVWLDGPDTIFKKHCYPWRWGAYARAAEDLNLHNIAAFLWEVSEEEDDDEIYN
jgi:hypothetical protein